MGRKVAARHRTRLCFLTETHSSDGSWQERTPGRLRRPARARRRGHQSRRCLVARPERSVSAASPRLHPHRRLARCAPLDQLPTKTPHSHRAPSSAASLAGRRGVLLRRSGWRRPVRCCWVRRCAGRVAHSLRGAGCHHRGRARAYGAGEGPALGVGGTSRGVPNAPGSEHTAAMPSSRLFEGSASAGLRRRHGPGPRGEHVLRRGRYTYLGPMRPV